MFAERFWSSDYVEGTDVLLAKLSQGVAENAELLALAQARADAERAHGTRLLRTADQLTPGRNGFGRDDGATMRKVYDGMLQQARDEARQHTHIAESITTMVIQPFTKWAADHAARIEASRGAIRRHTRAYDLELAAVHRAQQRYFNRCRLEEDASERGGRSEQSSERSGSRSTSVSSAETAATADADDSNAQANTSATSATSANSAAATAAAAANATSEELVFGTRHYSADESEILLRRMLDEIPQTSTKVSLLGTYDQTVTGAAIVGWITEYTAATSLGDAEAAGQRLVNAGFMRLIGQFGSRFVNSSVFVYQWRPRAFEFAGIASGGVGGAGAGSGSGSTGSGGQAAALYADLASRWARSDLATFTQAASAELAGGLDRLGEARAGAGVGAGAGTLRELDQKYRKAVQMLDRARVELETTLFAQFGYLERCERERLSAFKAVVLDFAAAVSNVVPALSAGVDQLLLHHEIADVDRDLRFLAESYQTGRYAPKVLVYDNYYSSSDGAAVFGLDLDLRSRADKKRVPVFVSGVLIALDRCYPSMEDDAERLGAWQSPLAPLVAPAQAARARFNVSTLDAAACRAIATTLEPIVLVQTLKLYFLELPTSVIGGQLYDLLRGVYAKFGEARRVVSQRGMKRRGDVRAPQSSAETLSDAAGKDGSKDGRKAKEAKDGGADSTATSAGSATSSAGSASSLDDSLSEKRGARLQALQNVLAQLTLSHIAVLDALTGHIARLVTIANASRADTERIARQWGTALCRPKTPSALSLDDVFPEQIVLDLLDHRERIFGELKRHAATLSPQDSVSSTSSRFRPLSARAPSSLREFTRRADLPSHEEAHDAGETGEAGESREPRESHAAELRSNGLHAESSAKTAPAAPAAYVAHSSLPPLPSVPPHGADETYDDSQDETQDSMSASREFSRHDISQLDALKLSDSGHLQIQDLEHLDHSFDHTFDSSRQDTPDQFEDADEGLYNAVNIAMRNL